MNVKAHIAALSLLPVAAESENAAWSLVQDITTHVSE